MSRDRALALWGLIGLSATLIFVGTITLKGSAT